VAVGIPQGVIADPPNRTLAGAVRRGGEIVTLSQDDYDLWGSLATPRTPATLAEVASLRRWDDAADRVRSLTATDLVWELDPSQHHKEQLSRLRPVPLGVGAGNLAGDSRVFQIKAASPSQPKPITVDAMTIMLWWEFDGATSLAAAIARVSARAPEVREEMIEALAIPFVLSLMAGRLLHLDRTYGVDG
jgi:hypothetical protein